MRKTKRGIAVVLLIAIVLGMNISSVFAAEEAVVSAPKVYSTGTNTLELEGKFVANGSDGAIWVKDGAQLTINGTDETEVHGNLGPDLYSMALWAKGEGTKVVINGGYYTNETDGSERGTDLIYVSDGAQLEINGGKFEAAKPQWTLNCKNYTTSKITVKGGTFYKFDPANPDIGTDGEIVIPDGYRVVKNGDWYTVGKENTITVKETENGTISVTQATAVVSEVVGLTTKANEGYKLANLTVTDANGKVVTVTNNEFTMPDCAVTVVAEFAKVTQNAVVSETIVQDTEEVEDVLLDSLKQDTTLEEKITNKDVVVNIELTDDNVNAEEKEEIEKVIEEKEEIKVSKYFDISVIVKDEASGEELGKLEELTKEIKLTVAIPEDLPEIAKGFTRKYYIVRMHNGVVEYLETTLAEDGKSLSFETDKFSTYALAYVDVAVAAEKDETPKMGAINASYIWVALVTISLVGIATTKKVSKHSK